MIHVSRESWTNRIMTILAPRVLIDKTRGVGRGACSPPLFYSTRLQSLSRLLFFLLKVNNYDKIECTYFGKGAELIIFEWIFNIASGELLMLICKIVLNTVTVYYKHKHFSLSTLQVCLENYKSSLNQILWLSISARRCMLAHIVNRKCSTLQFCT